MKVKNGERDRKKNWTIAIIRTEYAGFYDAKTAVSGTVG